MLWSFPYLKVMNYPTDAILGNTTLFQQFLNLFHLDNNSMDNNMYITVAQWLTGGSVNTASATLHAHAFCM